MFLSLIKDFFENAELLALTKELTETLRKNRSIDWQKKSSARARMRMMIKKLLKKYKYPPEGMDDALETVMTQCELWTDNEDMSDVTAAPKASPQKLSVYVLDDRRSSDYLKVAEAPVPYGVKKTDKK